MDWGEVEERGYAGPGECAKDAGEGYNHVDEGEHGVAHSEGGFGE